MTGENEAVGGLTRRQALLGGVGTGLGLAVASALGGTDAALAQTPGAAATPGPLSATKTVLTLDGAMAVLEAALAKARALGVAEVVAVVDDAGTLKALARMDGTFATSVDLAQDKAFTAASFHAPTDQLAKGLGSDAVVLASILKAPHISLLGGGQPLTVGNAVVGGVGCSGGTQEQDQTCARAGAATLKA